MSWAVLVSSDAQSRNELRNPCIVAILPGVVEGIFSRRSNAVKAMSENAFPLGFRAMYLWLRPYAQRVRQTPPERSRAERLSSRHDR